MAQSARRGRSRPGVYQRRGKWFYTLDLKDPATGAWRKKWSQAYATQAEAYQARIEALGRVQRGQWADPGRMTVGEYLQRWEQSRPVGMGLRATSANAYHYQLAWALPIIGQLRLRELEPDHLRALYRQLLASGGRGGRPLAVRTVQGVHTCLHKAFEDAVEDGLLHRNPADRVKRPVADHTPELALWDLDQALGFLAAARGDRLFAMWLLFLTTGMRRGEVAGLRWKDVNLAAGQLSVRHQRTCVNGRIVTNDPKTSGSRGTIAIGPDVVAALRQHQADQEHERQRLGPAWHDSGYVFVREDGTPLHPQQITRMFSRLVAVAGVPPVRLHDVRHTSATLLLEAGIPLKVVQERLRHASFTTTADLYAYVTAGMQQQAAVTIEALLGASERREPGARSSAPGEEASTS